MATIQVDSKRARVDKDKSIIFAVVSVAAFISVAAIMMSKGLWSQANYLSKVAGKKEVAVQQLKDNKAAVDSLQVAYTTFKEKNPNLLGGSSTGTGELDGDNARLILDSLPSKYDFPALTASLERLLTGYKINSITGIDDNITQSAVVAGGAVEIPFTVDVTTNYDDLKLLINSFNLSIRPFQITKLEFHGDNEALQANIVAKTYYQPEHGLEITSEVVQ